MVTALPDGHPDHVGNPTGRTGSSPGRCGTPPTGHPAARCERGTPSVPRKSTEPQSIAVSDDSGGMALLACMLIFTDYNGGVKS